MAIGLAGGVWWYEKNRTTEPVIVYNSNVNVNTNSNINTDNNASQKSTIENELANNINSSVAADDPKSKTDVEIIDTPTTETISKCTGLGETECGTESECLPDGCSCKTEKERFARCGLGERPSCDCEPDKFNYCEDLDCDHIQLHNGAAFIDCEEDYDCTFADTSLDLISNRCELECTDYSDEKYQAVSKDSYRDLCIYISMQYSLQGNTCTLNNLDACPVTASQYIPSCVANKCTKIANTSLDISDIKWKTVEYAQNGHQFSFRVPEDWEERGREYAPEERKEMIGIDSPKDVYVGVSYFNNDDESLGAWATKHKLHLEEFESSLRGISMKPVTVSGEAGYLYDLVSRRVSYQDFHQRYLMLVLERNQVVYRLSVGGGYNTFGEYANIIDVIINSFEVNET